METENGTTQPTESKKFTIQDESNVIKTVRLTINLLTNILIFLTVFVCLVYSCRFQIGIFQLHIILCVLGYQLFMCQGILVLSRHNSWSLHLRRRHRRYLHGAFQLIAVTMVTAGSVLIMKQIPSNFQTWHGALGILALVFTLLNVLNGTFAFYAGYLNKYMNVFWLKLGHHVTGIAALVLSAACLCTGFAIPAFRVWVGEDLVPVLIVFTLLFTVLVALDFWIVTIRRVRRRTMT